MQLADKRFWIFDMDGTLTLAQHDFAAIRSALGVPAGEPILEYLEHLPLALAAEKRQQLEAIEAEIAQAARAQPGAAALLGHLCDSGARVGLLTRNSLGNTHITLQAAGLQHFFPHGSIISRGCARPKPDPEGIHQLLNGWAGARSGAVMVGDYHFDIECGRQAGVTTISLDLQGDAAWSEQADLVVSSLSQLHGFLQVPGSCAQSWKTTLSAQPDN